MIASIDSIKYGIPISEFSREMEMLDDRDVELYLLREELFKLQAENLRIEKELKEFKMRKYY